MLPRFLHRKIYFIFFKKHCKKWWKNHYESVTINIFKNQEREIMEELLVLRK